MEERDYQIEIESKIRPSLCVQAGKAFLVITTTGNRINLWILVFHNSPMSHFKRAEFSLLWIVLRVLIWLYIQKFSPTSTFFHPSQRSCESTSWPAGSEDGVRIKNTSQPNQRIKDGHLRNSRWLPGLVFSLMTASQVCQHPGCHNLAGGASIYYSRAPRCHLWLGGWGRRGGLCTSLQGPSKSWCWYPRNSSVWQIESHNGENMSAANSCTLFHLCPQNFTL